MSSFEIRPQPGPQEQALASSADIVILGGAAGVGKTWALLIEPIRHVRNGQFGAVIFRRTSEQIRNTGGLWDESLTIYTPMGATPREHTLDWTFPSGMSVSFAGMEHAKDRFAWDGSQIALLGFDQLESFEEIQFWYMLSRNRSTCGVRPYVRATCNPVPEDDPVGGWLCRLIAWWIDPDTGYPVWSRAGRIRWCVRLHETLHWADDREALARDWPEDVCPCEAHVCTGGTDGGQCDKAHAKSLTFIPGKLEDNKILMRKDPGYRSSLLAMHRVERERLLGGNWKVRPAAGKVFDRAHFGVPVEARRAGARRVRYWDKAGTSDAEAAARTGDPDFSAGVLMSELDGVFHVEHVQHGRWTPQQRNVVMRQTAELDGPDVAIWVEQEPGSGGKESAQISVKELVGFNVRIERVTGDKVTRASGYAAQVEAGNVRLVRGDWNTAYLDEHHNFPDGAHDDQVDASAGAFNKLAKGVALSFFGGTEPDPPPSRAEQYAEAERARQQAAEAVTREIEKAGVFWPR